MQIANTDTDVQGVASSEPKMPSWLVVTDENVTVKLSSKRTLNGIEQDRIIMRSPTVKEVRACQQQAGKDDALLDDMLFSSLAAVGLDDIRGLTVKDYNRVQRGYFRLVEEDEV